MVSYSIIIVNYKTPQLVIDCLETIFSSSRLSEVEVIVVDNFSEDNSEELITKRFPQVRWIQMNYNSGFARANNAGILDAKGEIVLLLNSDTLNEDDAIMKCFDRLAISDYCACGIQLLNSDRSPQISGSYFTKGGLNQLMALPYAGRFIRWLGFALKIKKTSVAEASGVVEVDWINGAFLVVKKEAIEKVGPMDEDFFLYFEEIEWCSRLKKAGKLCIYGDLNIVHLQGATTNEVFGSTGQGYYNLYDRKGLQIMLSALLRIRKQYGMAWFLFHLLAYCFTIPVFFIGVVIGLPFKNRAYSFTQFAGYTRNCGSVLTLTGRILVNKPYFYKVL
jgi:GT2 family glycosyltransferase